MNATPEPQRSITEEFASHEWPSEQPPKPETNNVHSKDFESHLDDFFKSDSKEKESGRKCSIRIFGDTVL